MSPWRHHIPDTSRWPGTGILTEIGCINTLPILQNSTSSVVFIENCNWSTSRDNTYLLESGAGQLSVANTVVANASVSAGTYASATTSLLHYLYCDGTTWLVSLE